MPASAALEKELRAPAHWRWIGSSPAPFNREMSAATVRILNPTSGTVVARVVTASDELVTIESGGMAERAMRARVTVESSQALVVTIRLHDDEVLASEHGAQLLIEPIQPRSTIVAAACSPILVLTPSSACRFGTSGAAVEAIPGATYTWAVAGAAITGGDGTNRINLAYGPTPSASITVMVQTPDGCTRNGAATIALRDPFRIASLFASSVTIASPVTISWGIAGTDLPQSQMLTINGTPVKTAITDRSYTFTPATVGSYSVQLDASLIGGRRRSCCGFADDVPRASFCGADSRTTTFTVAPPCEPTTAAITLSSGVTQGEMLTGSVTANGSWTLTSSLGNPVTPSSGTGLRTFTYTGTTIGNDTLTLRVSGECSTVTRTAPISVTWGLPVVTLAADETNVWFNRYTILHVTIESAPDMSETTSTITSSRGNYIDPIATAGNDSLTFQYVRGNAYFDDTLTLTVTESRWVGNRDARDPR